MNTVAPAKEPTKTSAITIKFDRHTKQIIEDLAYAARRPTAVYVRDLLMKHIAESEAV
jgi:predicted DNA-binding protein